MLFKAHKNTAVDLTTICMVLIRQSWIYSLKGQLFYHSHFINFFNQFTSPHHLLYTSLFQFNSRL